MKAFAFLILFLALCLGLTETVQAAAPEIGGKRVALVIGNSAYKNAVRLPNPAKDAHSVAAKLRELGFIVVEGYDLDHEGMEDVVKDFSKAVRGADIGMFYYAGHGMQVNGKNYFVPVDAAFQDASALDFEAIPMELILRQMQNDVGVKLVILDACRDNPLSQTLSRSMAQSATGETRSIPPISEGLAEVKINDPGEGTAIIFATSPGDVALDGDGDHSPFTTALLDNISSPDTDLQVVMSRITGEVYENTKHKQRPWINASLTGEVLLNAKTAAPASQPQQPSAEAAKPQANDTATLERETALYNLARDSGQKEDYLAYLEVFPNGLYAVNARKQIERIDQGQDGKGSEVASVNPTAQPDGSSRSVAQPPLDLPITDAVKAAPANQFTEDALGFDRQKRQEIQTRLTLAGFAIKSPDGSFGGKTRMAIQAWQSSRGLPASGYLNQPQFEILTQQTQAAFAAYVPPVNPVAQEQPAAPVKRHERPVVRRQVHEGAPGSDDFGRFVGGVMRGVLGR
jgi:uncharacterized caspase-like protein